MMRAVALTLAVLATAAGAAPGRADLEAAALKTAQTLGGVLRGCPANFSQVGTPDKRCVGVGEGVEDARLKLNTALAKDLYGVWRSRDEQRSVYNWTKTAGGYVYLRLQPDPDGRAQTLIYLDLPPAQTGQTAGPDGSPPADTASANPTSASSTRIDSVTLTPAPSAVPEPSPSATAQPTPAQPDANTPPASPMPAEEAASATDLAPVPFGRVLSVQNRRLNGPDVLAVQNRLIALMRPQRPGQGDGWYGPLTAQTVRVFQKSSGLPATGVVDRPTWNRLFSGTTGGFTAPATP